MTDWYVHVAAQLELLHSEVSSRKHICKGVGGCLQCSVRGRVHLPSTPAWFALSGWRGTAVVQNTYFGDTDFYKEVRFKSPCFFLKTPNNHDFDRDVMDKAGQFR